MNNNTSCDQNNIIYNSFAPLQKYNIKCYNCNNVGHKSCDYKLIKNSIKMFQKKEKVNKEIE